MRTWSSFSTTPSVASLPLNRWPPLCIEPVLGEGGFVVPPAGFLPALADICRRHGIVFIADEVQTGFGRTGEVFACTHFGIEPDLILTAKSLGGGLPVRESLAVQKFMEELADSRRHRRNFWRQCCFLRAQS